MFWRFGFNSVSPIETLLEKGEEAKLEEFLDEDEVIQELKGHNKKLIDYLCQPEILRQLFYNITRTDLDENKKLKFPFVACELLSSDIYSIYEAIMQNPSLLLEFWQWLEKSPSPLNPLIASYFTKINIVLLMKMTNQMFHFIQNMPNVVDKLLSHLNTFAISDLLLKLMSCDNEENNVIGWLRQEHLVPKLLQLLDPSRDSEWHAVASQVLVDIVALSYTGNGDQPLENNVLLQSIKSKESIETLCRAMFDRQAQNAASSLVHGIDVLIELVRRSILLVQQGEAYANDGTNQPPPIIPTALIDLTEVLQVLGDQLPIMAYYLEHPTGHTDPIETTLGRCIPLGPERLKICEFLADLCHLHDANMNQRFIEARLFPICLDLFFTFTWNNFLHSAVCDMLANVFIGEFSTNRDLIHSIFVQGQLIQRIINAQKWNDASVEQPRGARLGYMGHLTLITDELLRMVEERRDLLSDQIHEWLASEAWQDYIHRCYRLQKERDTQPLGNTVGGDHWDTGMHDLDAGSEQMARYLVQRMTNDLPEQFGFDDGSDDQTVQQTLSDTDKQDFMAAEDTKEDEELVTDEIDVQEETGPMMPELDQTKEENSQSSSNNSSNSDSEQDSAEEGLEHSPLPLAVPLPPGAIDAALQASVAENGAPTGWVADFSQAFSPAPLNNAVHAGHGFSSFMETTTANPSNTSPVLHRSSSPPPEFSPAEQNLHAAAAQRAPHFESTTNTTTTTTSFKSPRLERSNSQGSMHRTTHWTQSNTSVDSINTELRRVRLDALDPPTLPTTTITNPTVVPTTSSSPMPMRRSLSRNGNTSVEDSGGHSRTQYD